MINVFFKSAFAGGCVGLNYIHTCYIRIQGLVVLGDLFAKSSSDIGASLPNLNFHTYVYCTYKNIFMYTCTVVFFMYEYSVHSSW
jgi:hypothetical protein